MTGTIAIVAAILFVVVALYRLAPAAPAQLRHLQLVLALVAGLAGIAHWHMILDSRWLVGGVLLVGAAVPGWIAGNRRGVAIAALVLGLLGAGLYGLAAANPMVRLVPADTI